jgi:hypothetical protein
MPEPDPVTMAVLPERDWYTVGPLCFDAIYLIMAYE